MATPRRTLIATERTLDEQYAEGEEELVRTRRHIFILLKPMVRALVPTVLATWYTLEIPTSGHVASFLWFVAMGLWLWVAWCEAERRRNVFVITTKRILLYEGIVTRSVPMMRLSKVTDLTYHRTVPGRIFRYGTIVIESAGQEQALNTITFLPEPDTVFAILNGALFGEKARERSLEGVGIIGHRRQKTKKVRRLGPGEPGDGPDDGRGGPGGSGDPSGPSGGPSGRGGGGSDGGASGGRGSDRPRTRRPGQNRTPGSEPHSPIEDYGASSDDDGPFLRGTSPAYQLSGHELDPPTPPGDWADDEPRTGRPRGASAYDPDADPTDIPPAGYRPRWQRVTDEDDGTTIYRSPDRRARSPRDEDTGPIPIEERRPRYT
ncbi:hypothetical protein BN12_600008 [Nostocoides japonicum T1-X7]|uniref:YdbS-like PH domain-containing protein n=1 Tax=Nostocoides japonicum T1-X7 TaxID=1194083 RepID=A0A077M0L9_9MICO|nr:PH domain-containing protein [Tetrasphaera japonica]CCH79848.1 hypothetical protein BN12_600008 [Tetrasphaera japonica T1-X7]